LLLTAYDLDIREIERAYDLGAIDYVPKPVSPAILRGKVSAFLDLHRASRELRQRTAALVAKDRHIAVLAHDLRNPLNTISVGADLVGRSSDEPKIKSTADRMGRAARRMNDMIRDLLDFARAGSATIPVVPVAMDAGDLCRELVEEFELADPKRRIELVCRGDLACRWDRARIYQALSNLVGNATRYGEGRARLEVAIEGDDLAVRVHNDGPPIGRDLLPRIFEPFERGSQDGSGLGLGLYIVRQIARGHGGDVSVTSSVEAGTTFVLRLPRTTNGISA
jgi:signal transduction histidine kinase